MDPSDLLLTDRMVLVTGAARGIGAATALAMADLGADLAICDREADGLAATAEQVRARGRTVVTEVLDVRDDDGVEAFMATAHGELGPLDVLVNNAGGGFWSTFDEVSPRGEHALIRENFGTVSSCVRHGVPRMNDGGAIVNVTSVEAYHAAPGFGVYSAMKAAVQQFTQTLAVELGHRRIRVNCVAPDMIPTPGEDDLGATADALIDGVHPTPLQRRGTPEECAAAICFLASDLAAFVTGSTLPVDGGTVAAGSWKVRLDGSFGM